MQSKAPNEVRLGAFVIGRICGFFWQSSALQSGEASLLQTVNSVAVFAAKSLYLLGFTLHFLLLGAVGGWFRRWFRFALGEGCRHIFR